MSVVSVFAALPHGAPLAMPLNDDTVTPGFLGFGVFLGLLIALVFLVRSMNTRIRKIQAPREADLRQREWERAQAAQQPGAADAAAERDDRPRTS